MAKVHNFLEMWQGSQNLRATQKEFCAQHKQVTAIGYISDTEEIIKPSWSNFQHGNAAPFELSERSTLPPAWSGWDLPGERKQVLNVHWIKPINRHPAKREEDIGPKSISDTKNWLNWNGDRDNPNNSGENCEADDESEIGPDNVIKASETPEHWVVSVSPDVPGLIRPTQRSMRRGSWLSVQWKQGGKRGTRQYRTDWVNMFSPGSMCCLTENFTYRNIMRG